MSPSFFVLPEPHVHVDWQSARSIIEHSSVVSGALSGCLHAIRRDFDVVGAVVIAIAAGLGGGMFRDVLLSTGPAYALTHPSLLIAALAACGFGMVLGTHTRVLMPIAWFVDSLALGLLTVSGIQRAQEVPLGVIPALFLGVITGTGGGLIRDVLCRERPELLVPGIPQGTASLLGGVVYVLAARNLHLKGWLCEWLAISASFGLRAFARWRGWLVPRPIDIFRWRAKQQEPPSHAGSPEA